METAGFERIVMMYIKTQTQTKNSRKKKTTISES